MCIGERVDNDKVLLTNFLLAVISITSLKIVEPKVRVAFWGSCLNISLKEMKIHLWTTKSGSFQAVRPHKRMLPIYSLL